MGFICDKVYDESQNFFFKKLPDGRFLCAQFANRLKEYGFSDPKKEKRIIVVLADGKHDYDQYSTESIARYSVKINASLHIMREFENVNKMIHWEKFRARKWLDEGYRVLLLDNDIVITSLCPNLFDLCPPEYMMLQNQGAFFWKDNAYQEKWYAVKLGEMLGQEIPNSEEYIKTAPNWNAGVMLLGPCHKQLFDLPENEAHREALVDWPVTDQTWLNYIVARDNIPVIKMPKEFNDVRPLVGDQPWIVHAAGVHNVKERTQFMASWASI